MTEIGIRTATVDDLPALVDLLADDKVAGSRENATRPIVECYFAAFHAISEDPHNDLLVAEKGGEVVGTMQMTFIPNMTCMGGWRAHVEGLMISSKHRGHGIGTKLMEHAILNAREKGCRLVQLTTNKQRTHADRFYEKLGFSFTHEGAKMVLVTNLPNKPDAGDAQ